MSEIKPGWSTVTLELVSVALGLLLFVSYLPLVTLPLLGGLIYLLARRRSFLWPLLLVFAVLLLARGAGERRAEHADGAAVGETERRAHVLADALSERVARDEEMLRTLARRIEAAGVLGGAGVSGELPFDLLRDAMEKHGGRRGIVLLDEELSWVSWGGEVRGIDAQFLKKAMEMGPMAAVEKGAVFTVLVMAYPLPGPAGTAHGMLHLSDVLTVEKHLEGIGLLGRGFLDDLGGGLSETAVLVPAGDAGGEQGLSVESFGNEIAVLLPRAPGTFAAADVTVSWWERWLLPFSLLVPLLLAVMNALRRIDAEILERNPEGRISYRMFLLRVLIAGLVFLGGRIALLEMDVPASLSDSPLLSPNLFASGLFDAGSGSIGDFLLSGFFIATWSLWYALRARRLVREQGALPSLPGRIAAIVCALILAGISPFILLRLISDTSGDLLMYGRPMESLAFACWEGSLFLLMFTTLLVCAILHALGGVAPGRWLPPLAISLILIVVLFFLPVLRPEVEVRGIFPILLSAAFISTSFLFGSLLSATRMPVPRGTGFLALCLAGIVFATLLLFPAVLWKRNRALVEDSEKLYEVAGKPIDPWVTFVLEEFIQSVESRKEEITDQLPSRETAFALWAQSPLSRAGTSSAVSIYDAEGKDLANFSLLPDPLPEGLADVLWQEVLKRKESFIYTTSVAEEEYYIATVPLEDADVPLAMVLARLPTGLARRMERGAAPFLMSQGDFPAGGGRNIVLLGEEGRALWRGRGVAEGESWTRLEGSAETGAGTMVSLRYIPGEERWLLMRIPLTGRGVILGMLVAVIIVNAMCGILPLMFFLIIPGKGWRGMEATGTPIFRSFRARLSLALFFFSLVPTLIWGLLARGAIVERIGKETAAEAQRILRDASLFLEQEGDTLGTAPFPADESVADLAHMIEAELLLYSGHMLVSSSRPDLVQSGILIPWMSPHPYIRLFLESEDQTADFLSLGADRYMMVYRRFTGLEGQSSLVLATPMLLRQEEIRQEVIALNYLLLIAVMSVLGASVLMGNLVAFFLTKPLGQLVRGTSRLAAGEFDYQLEEKRSDEFGELFDSFNEMARELRTSHNLLLSEKAKLESILKNVGAGVIVLNGRSRVVLLNDAASRIMGEDLSELPGHNLAASGLMQGPWREFVTWASRGISSGERQFTVQGAEGEMSVRSAKTTARLADGEMLSVIIFEDITESVRSQRVLAWALMARQIAHEIKNPLTPIRLAVQHIRRLFRDRVPDFEERLEENVSLVLREIDRLGRTASQFSSFAKAEEGSTVPLDPVPIIEETVALYRGDETGKKFLFEGAENTCFVLADEEGLRRVLVNLIENGRDAISGQGTISISLEERDGAVVLSVRDTGEGIPPELIGKVFEPDFTTRTDGTGLGLTIVKRITESWGGRIEIESAPGRGTCVRIFMKRADPKRFQS